MIDLEQIVYLVLAILVIGAVAGLLWWLVGYAERNGVPGPFCRVARVVMVVLGVLFLILFLINLAGHLLGRPMFRIG